MSFFVKRTVNEFIKSENPPRLGQTNFARYAFLQLHNMGWVKILVHEVDIILVFTQYRERGGLGGRGDFPPPGKLGGRSPLEKLGAQEESAGNF